MKKLLLCLVLLLGLGITTTSAQQEVRGIEIKVVTYEGEKYTSVYWMKGERKFGSHTTWLGWELRNWNSTPVSVDVEIYVTRINEAKEAVKVLDRSESIILQAGESHLLKVENDYAQRFYGKHLFEGIFTRTAESANRCIQIKYKAYKLE